MSMCGGFKHWLLQKRGGKTSMVGTIAEHLSIITLRQENGSVQRKCREGRCRELVSGSRHTLLCENMKKITLKDIYIYIYISFKVIFFIMLHIYIYIYIYI